MLNDFLERSSQNFVVGILSLVGFIFLHFFFLCDSVPEYPAAGLSFFGSGSFLLFLLHLLELLPLLFDVELLLLDVPFLLHQSLLQIVHRIKFLGHNILVLHVVRQQNVIIVVSCLVFLHHQSFVLILSYTLPSKSAG